MVNILFLIIFTWSNTVDKILKKSHTYEAGEQLKDFCLAFIDELEKQLEKTAQVAQ